MCLDVQSLWTTVLTIERGGERFTRVHNTTPDELITVPVMQLFLRRKKYVNVILR